MYMAIIMCKNIHDGMINNNNKHYNIPIVYMFCLLYACFLLIIGVDFFSRAILLNEKVVSLQLWDTAGQER